MDNNQEKNINNKQTQDSNSDHTSTHQLLDMVKSQHDKDLDQINYKFDQKLDNLSNEIKNMTSKLEDYIETVENKANNKLEGVDHALRGNGRIGLFEQIRGINTKIRIIFICLIFLFGFKVWGFALNDWMRNFLTNRQTITVPANIEKEKVSEILINSDVGKPLQEVINETENVEYAEVVRHAKNVEETESKKEIEVIEEKNQNKESEGKD